MEVSPNAPTTKANEIGAVADKLEAAEREYERFVEATRDDRRASIASRLGAGTRAAYLQVRSVVPPLTRDRVLEPDIRAVRQLLSRGLHVDVPLQPVNALAAAAAAPGAR